MRTSHAAISVLLTLVGQSRANKDVISLYTNTGVYIEEASATLVLGDTPSPMTGDVALWSAIMMDQQDFLQGVTENDSPSPYCGNIGAKWCNFAYTLVGSQTAQNGSVAAASPGSRVKTHYKLNSSTKMWDQNLYIDGQLVSSISTSKGQQGQIFYVSIECADGSCAAAPAHSWEDISIVLSKADTSFQHTGSWAQGATGGVMSTPDNGKTWNFTTLSIPTTSISYGES